MKKCTVSDHIENIVVVLILGIMFISFISMIWNGLILSLQKHDYIAKEDLNGQKNIVDWAQLYPAKEENDVYYSIDLDNDVFFEDLANNWVEPEFKDIEDIHDEILGEKLVKIEDSYFSAMNQLKKKVNESKSYIPKYSNMAEFAGRVNLTCGKSYFDEHNDIYLLPNGQLTGVEERYTIESIKYQLCNIINFEYWLDSKGIDFAYIQYPYKEAAFNEMLPEGAYDYADHNADTILKYLQWKEINNLDLRDEVVNDKLDYSSLFFKTDHHWNLYGGKYAATKIGEYLKSDFGYDMDTDFLSDDKFYEEKHEKHSLGSYGRKVTLAEVVPDDFDLLIPNYETSFEIENKDIGENIIGTFSDVMIDRKRFEEEDYYNNICYDALLYGNRPLTRITNLYNDNGPKILIIRDSFSLAMAPYLALMAKEVDLIDVRSNLGDFSGSIKTFIDDTSPDIVIIMTDIGQYKFF